MPIIICGISFLHISAFSSVSLREIVRHLLSREAAVALRATDPQRLCLNRNKLAFPEKRANVSTVAVDLSGRKGKKRKKKKEKEKTVSITIRCISVVLSSGTRLSRSCFGRNFSPIRADVLRAHARTRALNNTARRCRPPTAKCLSSNSRGDNNVV
jgi:hypothetical protein